MSGAVPHRPVILVVDDSADTLTLATDILEGQGMTALIARSGAAALVLIERVMPDLVLMDALMPEMDGFEACRRIKTSPRTAHVPLIFMTGLSDTEHVVRGFRAGGNDYVTKPIVPDELVARILGNLSSARLAQSARVALDVAGTPLLALAGALLFGWFAVRLSGVYLAMLTLAFAQIVWAAVFQWEALTGGSNGIVGVWPERPFDGRSAYYWLALALAVVGVLWLRRVLFAPFGYAMRAGRDSPLRAEAIGLDVKRVHWLAFAIAGLVCGVAGGLFAFAKGSISPETIAVGRSIDGLVMVLLGGIQTLTGPVVGASAFAVLQDTVMRQTEYWRALLGGVILLLVLSAVRRRRARRRRAAHQAEPELPPRAAGVVAHHLLADGPGPRRLAVRDGQGRQAAGEESVQGPPRAGSGGAGHQSRCHRQPRAGGPGRGGV